jgi:serine/threonine protein kinase
MADISGWLKKKGSRFGFWHRRYCILDDSGLRLYKSEGEATPERTIRIKASVRIEFTDRQKPARLLVVPEADAPLCLAHESPFTVRAWCNALRARTIPSSPDLTMSHFDILSVLGKGAFGKVRLCRKKATGELFAIKSVSKGRLISSHNVNAVFAERNVLMKVDHPFIVQFGFAFQTPGKVYLGLEYVAGGELYQHLRKRKHFTIEQVRLYIAEISLALNYLHVNGVIYRDLKPENVLLDLEGHVKLADFGLVKQLDRTEDAATTFCGSPVYQAPEELTGEKYRFTVDWWAVGVLTWELLYGKPPFNQPHRHELYMAIRFSDPAFPDKVDPHFRTFVSMLLDKDPETRAGFEKPQI